VVHGIFVAIVVAPSLSAWESIMRIFDTSTHYHCRRASKTLQEIGRAGRDGKDSICEMLACGSDGVQCGNFTYVDTPDAESVSRIVENIVHT